MVTITEQIKVVRREIGKRKTFYPKWVAEGKMTSANRVFSCKNNGLQSKLQPVFSLAALAGQSSNDIITRLRAHRAEVLAIKEQLEFVRQKFAA